MRRLLLLAICLGLPKEGHVGRIHYRAVTLEELVRRSSLILLAEFTGSVTREIPLLPSDPKKHPPFTYGLMQFKVVEVLKQRDPGRLPAEVHVQPAHLSTKFSVRKRYEVEGLSKSPLYDTYDSRAPLEKGGRTILFLGSGHAVLDGEDETPPNLYSLLVDHAFESEGKKAEIIRLIKSD